MKRILSLILIVFFVSVLGFFIAPYIFLDSFIEQGIEEIKEQEGVAVQYESSSLGFAFSNISITGVKVYNPAWSEEESIIDVEKISMKFGPLDLLFNERIEFVKVISPRLKYRGFKNGGSNFDLEVLGEGEEKKKEFNLGEFVVEDLIVDYIDQSSDVKAELNLGLIDLNFDDSTTKTEGSLVSLKRQGELLYSDRVIDITGEIQKKEGEIFLSEAILSLNGGRISIINHGKEIEFSSKDLHPLMPLALLPDKYSPELDDIEASSMLNIEGVWDEKRGIKKLVLEGKDIQLKNRNSSRKAKFSVDMMLKGRKVKVDDFVFLGDFGKIKSEFKSRNLIENKIEAIWDLDFRVDEVLSFIYSGKVNGNGEVKSKGQISHKNSLLDFSNELNQVSIDGFYLDLKQAATNEQLISEGKMRFNEQSFNHNVVVNQPVNYLKLNEKEVQGDFLLTLNDNRRKLELSLKNRFKIYPSRKLIHFTGVPFNPVAVYTSFDLILNSSFDGNQLDELNYVYKVNEDSLENVLSNKNGNFIAIKSSRPKNLTTYFLQKQMIRCEIGLVPMSTGVKMVDNIFSIKGGLEFNMLFSPNELLSKDLSNISFENIDLRTEGKSPKEFRGDVFIKEGKVRLGEGCVYSGNKILLRTTLQLFLDEIQEKIN